MNARTMESAPWGDEDLDAWLDPADLVSEGGGLVLPPEPPTVRELPRFDISASDISAFASEDRGRRS